MKNLSKVQKILIGVTFGVVIVALAVVLPVTLTLRRRSESSDKQSSSFYVIPLGTNGGLDESDISCYLLTSINDDGQPNSVYITLDGGTLRHGLDVAIRQKLISSENNSDTFIKNNIQAYLISHGHMDHLDGFILNTPNDKKGKLIVGLNETLEIIQNYYFNGYSWADFGPRGLKTYDYLVLDPTKNISVAIANTDFDVRIFRLCHICPYLSSAFLVSHRNSNESILYLGDTGPDNVEQIVNENNQTIFPRYLEHMWNEVRPLVISQNLKAIFIEVSYPNERPDNLLFGHLTPDHLIRELRLLKQNESMKQVKIFVTHIKPEGDARNKIIDQLTTAGADDFTFLFPQQGQAFRI